MALLKVHRCVRSVTLVCLSVFLQEVAEPLQDLKEGMDQLEKNKTLRYILTTLLAIGNFLNSTEVSSSEDMNDSGSGPSFSFTLFPPTLLLLLPCQQIVLARKTVGSLCVQECAHTVLLQ